MKIPTILQTFWHNKALPFLRNLNAKQQFILFFCTIVFLLWLVKLAVSPGNDTVPVMPQTPLAEVEEMTDDISEDSLKISPEDTLTLVAQQETQQAQTAIQEKTRQLLGGRKAPAGWPYFDKPIRSWREEDFSDLQDVQIVAARKNGLKKPIRDRKMAEDEALKGELVFIGANPLFYVEDLKHSVPFLVPKAYKLLNRIGLNFIDSLASKGLPPHALLITSVLRTKSDVSNLRNNNGNATENSAHQYATTVDISWRSFVELGMDPQGTSHDMTKEVALKNALGEVLRDLRYEGRCYVKHEVKQPCFHITVR